MKSFWARYYLDKTGLIPRRKEIIQARDEDHAAEIARHRMEDDELCVVITPA